MQHIAGYSYQNDAHKLSSHALSDKVITAADIPSQQRKFTIPDPVDLASVNEWVTVYGISSSNLSLALHAMLDFGRIVRVSYGDQHTIHVRFEDALSAQSAVSARTICLSKVSIIGIIPCRNSALDSTIKFCRELELPPHVLAKETPPVISNGVLERIINWFTSLLA